VGEGVTETSVVHCDCWLGFGWLLATATVLATAATLAAAAVLATAAAPVMVDTETLLLGDGEPLTVKF
jgi:hypothetical protein